MKQSESIIVNESEAVKLLQSADGARYLTPFYTKAKSLSEAAKEIGVSISAYTYWIKKFVKANLVIVSHTKERPGNRIKYYITPAKHMVANLGRNDDYSDQFIQAAIDEYNSDLAKTLTSVVMSWDADIGIDTSVDEKGEMVHSMYLISRDGTTTPMCQELLESSRSAAFGLWFGLPLRFEDAKELQQKMFELAQEYEQKAILGQGSYMIQMVIVPEKT